MSKDKTEYSQLSLNDLQVKIEDFKQKRDDLNKKTREYIDSLQKNENEIIDLLKSARDVFKPRRDHWNKKVRQLKNKKDEYKNILDKLVDERREVRKDHKHVKGSKSFTSVKKLERKIEFFERVIDTENLEINEENEIVDKIRDLEKEKQELKTTQQDNGIYLLVRKIEIVKINLNKIYEQLNKWSSKSQKYHMKMLELYQKANTLKENKKQMEEELIYNKREADKFHNQYLEVITHKKRKTRHKKPYKSNYQKGPRTGRGQRPKNKHQEMLEKLKKEKLAVALEKKKAGKKLNLFEVRLILEQSDK